jgi:hypothetical protein
MRPLAALAAFLDVSSLNLAVPQGAAIFSRRVTPPSPHVEPGASAVWPGGRAVKLNPLSVFAVRACVSGRHRRGEYLTREAVMIRKPK